MALIKLGSVVTRISGKVGGQTFGQTAAGAYLKNSGTPRKAITNLQRQKMSRMATTAQAWRGLSESEKDVFRAATEAYPYLNRVGETKYYSGYAIFAMLKNNLLNIGSNANPVPLPKTTFLPLDGVVMFMYQGEITLRANQSTDANATYRVFMTRPASKGISNAYKNLFFIQDVTYTELANSVSIDESVRAKFGPFPSNSRSYFRLDGIDLNKGQVLKNMASGYFQT